MKKLIIIVAITSCLAACVVDDNSADWAQSSPSLANEPTERFAEAAQKACGQNAAWERMTGGVQCYTHRGARTGKVVQP